VSKLGNLYHFSHKNGICIFLLSISLITTSFADDSKKIKTDNKIRTVVIDPGHGGKDSGTMGTKRFNIYEKHVALAISLKLGHYIENAFPEVEIIYTRDKDVFLELNERTDIANNANADLFISIHCDGFTDSSPSGASVFVMGMSKLKANMDVAMRENSAIYLEDNYQQKYDGFDPESTESYIVFSLMQNTYLNQSLSIAEEVEKEFSTRANRKSRGVKQAPFYVISRTNMPSILIECGFLTNPKEEVFLHSEQGQDYLASAIFRAFRSYKQNVEGLQKDDLIDVEKNPDSLISKEYENVLPDSDGHKVVFKIQIGTYLQKMISNNMFQEIGVEEEYKNGVYKYYTGKSYDKKDMDELKLKMREKGFKGAFVVAFYQGNKISIKEALSLQKK